VMQQQYISLSPMPGQEFTGPSVGQASSSLLASHHGSITAQLMDHTPTTSSMLAALHDTYTNDGQSNQQQGGAGSFDSSNSYYGNGNGHSNAGSGAFGDYGGSFDMSFLNGSPAANGEGHSPAAGSVGSSSASVAELAAGVAAAAVGSDAGIDSPLISRRGSGDLEAKHEGN